MKNFGAVAIAAVSLCGCGWSGKLDSVSRFEGSATAYKSCMAEHRTEPARCENARLLYQIDLKDAERARGVLTNWRWL